MRLKKMKLKNFRAYKNEVEISFDNLTAIIGKNDIGKSTILEALEIFFNGESKTSIVSCEQEDLCIYADTNYVEITCIFDELPDEIVIDSQSSTTFQEEFLLNEDGMLEIKKRYDCSLQKPKVEVVFVCNQPDDVDLSSLPAMGNTGLKTLASTLGIDKSTYNASVNTEIRRAIRIHKNITEYKIVEIIAKEDAKKLWDNIQQYIPIFALFQSDRNSSDSDREVSDPMKIAIKQALQTVTKEIEDIKHKVMEEALKTANETLTKLHEMSPDLAESLIPEFSAEPKFDSVFKLSINSDNNIPMNKRGSGVRRLLLLNFFRAEAERKMSETSHNSVIYAFEEPETSQHPDNQLLLIEAFKEISIKNGVQVILTTHNPALAGEIDIASLRFVDYHPNAGRCVKQGSDEVYNEICNELGMLPEPIEESVNAILLVEGPGDVVFVNHIADVYFQHGILNTTFERAKFAVIPVGGCGTLKYWCELKLIEKFNRPCCVLLDSDFGANEDTKNLNKVEELRRNGIKAYVTRKREPENYISPDCVRKEVHFTEQDDAKKIISTATKIRANNVLITFWPQMTYEQIREVDRYLVGGEEHYEFKEMFEDFFSIVQLKTKK